MDKHTMTDTTDYDDNHPVCGTCGCGPCACEEDPDYCNGSDICEPWAVRTNPYYQPPDRYGISVFGLLLLATVLAGLIASVGMRAVQAQDTTLRAPHAVNGRIYEWPAIGAEVYSRSCAIVRFWEDGSATAYCREDDAVYRYDPDGQPYANAAGNALLAPGWYPVSTSR